MVRAIGLAGAIMAVSTSVAVAAGLADRDYRYLDSTFGLARDSGTIRSMSAGELSRLHDLINDPSLKRYPAARERNVADLLFDAHMRECSIWAMSHTGPICPPTANASAEPGQDIADRQCNACHLFGAGEAPPFRRLAADPKLNEQFLSDAMAHGHAMSPIILQPAQVAQLLVYIRSLK